MNKPISNIMRERRRLETAGRHLGYLSGGGVFALLAVMLLAPTITPTSATEIQPFSADVNTKTSVYVRSSIALSMSSNAKIDLVPTSQGTFSESSDVSLSVATNNTTGYELYLSTGDNTSSLSQRNATDDPASINPVNGTMTASNYKEHLNSWGYNIESNSGNTTSTSTGEYKAIPKQGEASIARTDAIAANDTYTMKFGAAVSTGLPAGVYSNTVVASVIANPIEVRSLSDITTMQEMTTNICTVSLENETKQLIDTRDGKSYWVAKLKDGNCWMTQNLALDITEDGLKATDTDIATDWNQSSEYPPEETASDRKTHPAGGDDGAQATGTRSWGFGKFVLATSSSTETCTIDSGKPLSACATAGLVDVNSDSFQPGYQTQIGTWTYPDGTQSESTTVAVNCTKWEDNICTAGTYDEHYLIGNYYQFNTATAGNGGTLVNQDIVGSICPRGWELPNVTNYQNLKNSYSDAFAANDITTAPFYFTRPGSIVGGTLFRVGAYGSFRAKSALGTENARLLTINNDNVNILDTYKRGMGFSVRCINSSNI